MAKKSTTTTATRVCTAMHGLQVHFFHLAVRVIIVVLLIALLIFVFSELYDIVITSFLDPKSRNLLHDIAFILVFVKAIKMLIAYLQTDRIAITYLVEISIIAPAIEIIFAADRHSPVLLTIIGVFGMANLLVYILLHEKLVLADKNLSSKSVK